MLNETSNIVHMGTVESKVKKKQNKLKSHHKTVKTIGSAPV